MSGCWLTATPLTEPALVLAESPHEARSNAAAQATPAIRRPVGVRDILLSLVLVNQFLQERHEIIDHAVVDLFRILRAGKRDRELLCLLIPVTAFCQSC